MPSRAPSAWRKPGGGGRGGPSEAMGKKMVHQLSNPQVVGEEVERGRRRGGGPSFPGLIHGRKMDPPPQPLSILFRGLKKFVTERGEIRAGGSIEDYIASSYFL